MELKVNFVELILSQHILLLLVKRREVHSINGNAFLFVCETNTTSKSISNFIYFTWLLIKNYDSSSLQPRRQEIW